MDNLIYGLRLKDKRLYVEETEDLMTDPQAAFIDDRNYAKEYEYFGSAKRVMNCLLKNNIETEVIVLRERLG